MSMIFLNLLALVGAPAVAQDRAPVLVELFTAQGCAACPDANAQVGALAERDGVLVEQLAGPGDLLLRGRQSGVDRLGLSRIQGQLAALQRPVGLGVRGTGGTRRLVGLAAVRSSRDPVESRRASSPA